MEFVAIDVETANADMATICQIGLVKFEESAPAAEWKTYLDPEDYFAGINVSIHGIDEELVAGAPTFPEVIETLRGFLDNKVVVCHTHFDRVALHQAAERYGLSAPVATWLDSARVARRTWSQCARKGYGLYKVCEMLGYEFKHHDALEDAKAAAHILCAAANENGLDINGLLKKSHQPIGLSTVSTAAAAQRDGNPEGELGGEVMVFTGTLEIPRREATDLALGIGCSVAAGVTQKTTLLVVGDQDVTRFAGKDKSSKHLKAERLIAKGQPIRIIKEGDFKELVAQAEEIA